MSERDARTDPFGRVLGFVTLALTLAGLVWMARSGLDAPLLLGLGAGLLIALAWRPVQRTVTRGLDRWIGRIRAAALRVPLAVLAFPIPFLLTPFGAGLLLLIDARFGLAALAVAFGDSFVRMALGWPVGPETDR